MRRGEWSPGAVIHLRRGPPRAVARIRGRAEPRPARGMEGRKRHAQRDGRRGVGQRESVQTICLRRAVRGADGWIRPRRRQSHPDFARPIVLRDQRRAETNPWSRPNFRLGRVVHHGRGVPRGATDKNATLAVRARGRMVFRVDARRCTRPCNRATAGAAHGRCGRVADLRGHGVGGHRVVRVVARRVDGALATEA